MSRATNHGWTLREELAATQIEMTDLWGRVLTITLGQPVDRLPKFPQIKHPGRGTPESERPPVTTDTATIRKFFQGR